MEYGNVGFRERGNLEYMYGEKTSRSKGENPILLRCRDLKSVHIGERWMLSRLRYPLIPSLAIYIYDLTDQITFFLVPRSHPLTIPTTSPLGSSNRFVSLLYTTRQQLKRIGPRVVFSLVAISGGISVVLYVPFTPGGFTSASSSVF